MRFPEEGKRIADKDSVRVNERIRAREIRLIGADGEQLGVVTPEEGRTRADEEGYDLVEVAPNASPPVCRIMDYGKYKYEQKKKTAAGKAKGKGRAASLKEVKMRPSTDDHDLAFKLKNARRFLMDGDKVKVTVMFRGREMAHRRNGYAKLNQVKEMLGEMVTIENPPQMSGRFLSMIMVPNREAIEAAKKKAAREEAAREETGPEEAAQEEAAQEEAAQEEAAQEGAAQEEAAQEEAAQEEAAQEGAAKEEAAQEEAAQEGAAKEGAAQEEAAQEGAAQEEAAQEEAAQEEAARQAESSEGGAGDTHA